MIARLWRGWTRPADADRYDRHYREEFLPTLRQLSGRWRLVIMTVLASLPVIIAVLMLRSDDAPSVVEFETAMRPAMRSVTSGAAPL